MSAKPPSGRSSAIAALRQNLFLGEFSDDIYDNRATDRIVEWAKTKHGAGGFSPDAAELLARHIMKTKGWSVKYIAHQNLQDLVLLIDDDKPESEPSKSKDHPESTNSDSKSRVLANTEKLFPKGVPDNTEIVDVVVRLDSEKGSGKSERQIAREYTHEHKGNMPKAQSLLAQIRRMKREGRVNL